MPSDCQATFFAGQSGRAERFADAPVALGQRILLAAPYFVEKGVFSFAR